MRYEQTTGDDREELLRQRLQQLEARHYDLTVSALTCRNIIASHGLPDTVKNQARSELRQHEANLLQVEIAVETARGELEGSPENGSGRVEHLMEAREVEEHQERKHGVAP